MIPAELAFESSRHRLARGPEGNQALARNEAKLVRSTALFGREVGQHRDDRGRICTLTMRRVVSFLSMLRAHHRLANMAHVSHRGPLRSAACA